MSRALLFDALKALEGVKDAEWDADSVDGRRLIAALRSALAEQPADDGRCPTCGEDGGTSCGMPNCGLIVGDEAEQPAPHTEYVDTLIDRLLMPPPAQTEADLKKLHREAASMLHLYKAKLAERPAAPVVLTGEDLRNIARSLPAADCDRLTAEWRSVSMFARAILAAAIPPGHVVVKDEPVAWMFEYPDKRIAPKFDSAPHGGSWKPLYAARPGGKG